LDIGDTEVTTSNFAVEVAFGADVLLVAIDVADPD
jgi:hypothetical protein